ncbi:hypothetical protein [Alteribacillus sp. YIM 98480]|uniref:hypothetical protein n=1 Tax=Alteribacillus sp. YIM 98480 TaxID=2606599 RepID=UPI00131CBEC2|nr:hypothetical protein [Alteribacillus sp. YIM 98480]
MGEAIIFGAAVFAGWIILDYSKEKKWRKVSILESFLAGAAGAVGWLLLELVF